MLGSTVLCFAQEETINIETELVNLNVVVTDRQGRRVSGLTKDDFEVYEDGAPQEIAYFTATDRLLKLVLLFDVSISMDEVLPGVKRQAINLIDNLQPNDEVAVVSFATEVHRHSDWVRGEKAKNVVRLVTPEEHPLPLPPTFGRTGYRVGDGNTFMYEALQHVLENFKPDDDVNDRVAVVMFTDGVDTGAGRWIGRINKRVDEVGKKVKRYAEEGWALFYPVRYKTNQVIGAIPKPAPRPFPNITIRRNNFKDPGPELLAKIAAATGGEAFAWTTEQDLNRVLEQALTDLRSQYGVAYKPPRTNSNGFRHIKVRVKRPDLVARTRDGYRTTQKD